MTPRTITLLLLSTLVVVLPPFRLAQAGPLNLEAVESSGSEPVHDDRRPDLKHFIMQNRTTRDRPPFAPYNLSARPGRLRRGSSDSTARPLDTTTSIGLARRNFTRRAPAVDP